MSLQDTDEILTIKFTVKCESQTQKLYLTVLQDSAERSVSPSDQLTVAPTQDPHSLHLQELGDVDQDGAEDGREDVKDDPLRLGLDLPVVVRPADGCEPLHPHRHDDVDTAAHADPRGDRDYLRPDSDLDGKWRNKPLINGAVYLAVAGFKM